MKTDQLDLFRLVTPATVAVFPLAKRVAKVRRVAETLAGKDDQSATTYWRQTVTRTAAQLERIALPPKAIQLELKRVAAKGIRDSGIAGLVIHCG